MKRISLMHYTHMSCGASSRPLGGGRAPASSSLPRRRSFISVINKDMCWVTLLGTQVYPWAPCGCLWRHDAGRLSTHTPGGGRGHTASVMPVSAHVSKVRSLYKRILVLHRFLPIDLRALGDQYVKDEFRRHGGAAPEEAAGFMAEWKVNRPEPPREEVSWPETLLYEPGSHDE